MGIVGKEVPGVARCGDDIVICFVDVVREPISAQIFPDIFDGIEFWRIGWKPHGRDIAGDGQIFGDVEAGAIEDQHGVGTFSDLGADIGEMRRDGRGVEIGHHQC